MTFWRLYLCPILLGSLVAVPARADVLQVSPTEEAVWLSGPRVSAQADNAEVVVEDRHGAATSPEPTLVPAAPVSGRQSAMIPARYAAAVYRISARYRLSPALIEALVWQESRWRESAVSPAGARGLAQLMPATARDLGVNPDDPFANLEGGARYLREQLNRFNGDLARALAAYNAGPRRVVEAGGIPRIRETQTYVAAILSRMSRNHRSSQ